MPRKQYWKIEVYDGATQTYVKVKPIGSLGENQVVALLQRLAAMHLNEDEIVECSLRKNALGYRSLLQPQRGRDHRGTITINAGRTYVASVWAEHELADCRE